MIEYELIIALLSLIVSNILLGTATATIKYEFNKKTFFNGLLKGTIIVLGFLALYVGAYYSKDVVSISINGTNYTLMEAINVIVIGGISFYALKVYEKFKEILGTSTSIEPPVKEPIVEVPQENNIRGQ